MPTSIATVSISGDLRDKRTAFASAGFDGIAMFEQDFIAFDGSPREVGAMVRDHGLAVTPFQPFRDFEGLPAPQRRRAFARAERKFDLMAELGAGLVLVCSSVHPAAMGGIDRAAADIHAPGGIAAARGLRVGFEALAWGRPIFSTALMPRRWWGAPITPPVARSSTVSTPWRAASNPGRSGASPATGSFSCIPPMRRRPRWICCISRAMSATSPARAISM